jgi:hypothetical protein
MKRPVEHLRFPEATVEALTEFQVRPEILAEHSGAMIFGWTNYCLILLLGKY